MLVSYWMFKGKFRRLAPELNLCGFAIGLYHSVDSIGLVNTPSFDIFRHNNKIFNRKARKFVKTIRVCEKL